ncbi:MAG: type II CAAX endopeptidase family protein [Acidobacteriota bacterium]|jgi:membrane protease YdiL (CAAX protease family)
MRFLQSFWQKLPLMVRAILIGFLVTLCGNFPWSVLTGVNLKLAPSFPWAVPAMVLYLWSYWRYLAGRGAPKSTTAVRRASFRARCIPGSVWLWALAAGVLGLACAVTLQQVYARFVQVPVAPAPNTSGYPLFTVLCLVLMSAAVAGITEEAGFRGYMQSAIERRHGPAIAITVAGIAFGALHLTHGFAHTLPRLPYYFAIALVYGAIAYLTNSILPSMVIHACGDALEFMLASWRAALHPPPPIWQSGPDRAFWVCGGLACLFGVAAIYVYRKLGAAADVASHDAA